MTGSEGSLGDPSLRTSEPPAYKLTMDRKRATEFPGALSRKPLYKPGSIAYVTNPLLALALEGSN